MSAKLGGVCGSRGVRGLHCSESQDDGNGYLGLRVHLHVPDQKDREDAECPVRGRTHSGIGIDHGCGVVRVDARAPRRGWIPESRDRTALEEDEEEEEDPKDSADTYCKPDDLDVSSMHRNP